MKGFTLVELMLSMTFIAILLLSITMLIVQIAGIYNKGITLREADQAGQFVSSELQRSFTQTFSQAVGTDAVQLPDGKGGRVCIGGDVYAWNYGEGIEEGSTINVIGGSSDVRFVKFAGPADEYCEPLPDDSWQAIPSNTTELLSPGNASLAIHSLEINEVELAQDDTQSIYEVNMVLGTTEGGLITSDQCNGADKKDDEWCAVNEFSFTARSGNKQEG